MGQQLALACRLCTQAVPTQHSLAVIWDECDSGQKRSCHARMPLHDIVGLPEPPAPSKPVIKEEEAAPVDPCSTADDAAAVASPKKVTPKRSTRGAKGKAAPAGSTDAGGGAAGKTEAGNGLDATKSSTDAEVRAGEPAYDWGTCFA